jgi:hypothetical protein
MLVQQMDKCLPAFDREQDDVNGSIHVAGAGVVCLLRVL